MDRVAGLNQPLEPTAGRSDVSLNFMKTRLLQATTALALALPFILGASLYAQSPKKINAVATVPPVPKGATHTVLHSIGEAKSVFTYSPTLAVPEVPEPADGLYRLEVNEKGKVASVTILRGISPRADTFVLKQFVAWYAKPGALRIVDVPVIYAATPKLLNPFTSRRSGLPPR